VLDAVKAGAFSEHPAGEDPFLGFVELRLLDLDKG
jgi:hypothetical protein